MDNKSNNTSEESRNNKTITAVVACSLSLLTLGGILGARLQRLSDSANAVTIEYKLINEDKIPDMIVHDDIIKQNYILLSNPNGTYEKYITSEFKNGSLYKYSGRNK